MDGLAYSLVRERAIRERAVRARGLGIATCLVCGAVRSRAVLSAVGCAVYANIETCAPHFLRVCLQYGVRRKQRMAMCKMCGAVRPRTTYRDEVCGQS